MNLKKSYKSLFLIVLIFIVGGVGIVLLPVNESMMVRIIFNYMDLFCVILLNVVYKTERVYWITGITYEEALEAGSERRKRYAKCHLRDFGFFSIGYLILSVLLHLFHITFYVDIGIYLVGICAICVGPIRYKL